MMTTTETRFMPALVSPDFDSFAVRQAIAGFLAGYGETTRQAYSLDLRQWLHDDVEDMTLRQQITGPHSRTVADAFHGPFLPPR